MLKLIAFFLKLDGDNFCFNVNEDNINEFFGESRRK